MSGTSEQEDYQLQTSWSFWHQTNPGPGNVTPEEYKESFHKLCTFSTIMEFWACFNHLPATSKLKFKSTYHLFREGLTPTWEDVVDGGFWVLRVPKDQTGYVWKELVLAAIGEQWNGCIGDHDDICGITVSIRQNDDIVQIWNTKATANTNSVLRRALELIPACNVMNSFYRVNKETAAMNKTPLGSSPHGSLAPPQFSKETRSTYGCCAVRKVKGVVQYLLSHRRYSVAFKTLCFWLNGTDAKPSRETMDYLLKAVTNQELQLLLDPNHKDWETYVCEGGEQLETVRIALVKNRDEFSSALRTNRLEPRDANWGWPKGNQRGKEDEKEACIREFCEEMEVDRKNVTRVVGSERFRLERKARVDETLVLYVEVSEEVDNRRLHTSKEADERRWCSRDDAQKLINKDGGDDKWPFNVILHFEAKFAKSF